jgi:hypothetical protein
MCIPTPPYDSDTWARKAINKFRITAAEMKFIKLAAKCIREYKMKKIICKKINCYK